MCNDEVFSMHDIVWLNCVYTYLYNFDYTAMCVDDGDSQSSEEPEPSGKLMINPRHACAGGLR